MLKEGTNNNFVEYNIYKDKHKRIIKYWEALKI